MDDVLTFADEAGPQGSDQGPPWKILIADDEPSVHLVTKLALGDFTFEGRRLELFSAYGETDTRKLLTTHPDIALILLDVVMDTMDSGFSIVKFIREELKNHDVRIIMRTGQSGNAPEDRIIIDYDINDFKDKTELTVAKLRTTMISSLRTFSHLKIIAEEQRKASASRHYLHSIIDSLSSVLVTLDLDLKVLLWNREAERWTGIPAAEAVGRNLFEAAEVFSPLKALFQGLRTPGAGGVRIERSAVPLWKGGQVYVHLILQTLAGTNGPEILFRLDDRTIAKHQDEQLIRSQKVSAFSTLAAGIAGELHQGPTPGSPGLLDRLARFSPLSHLPREPRDWDLLLRRHLETLVLPGSVTLEYEGPGEPALVAAPEAGLKAMADQLLDNALAALTTMPGAAALKGPRTVKVSLGRAPGPEGEAWALTVADQGVGMVPEVALQVFDPYFTTKPDGRGLGLGLPLVYSLTEGLGGQVDLHSVPGAGTTVRVQIPAWKTEADAPGAAGPATVLICDDEPLMRQMAQRVLKLKGYRVLEAADGPAALEVVQAEGPRLSLILLDLLLPGMSGLEVLDKVRLSAPGVPVLLSSGFGRGDEVDRALAGGAAGFLQKPYRAEALTTAVKNLLEGQKTSG